MKSRNQVTTEPAITTHMRHPNHVLAFYHRSTGPGGSAPKGHFLYISPSSSTGTVGDTRNCVFCWNTDEYASSDLADWRSPPALRTHSMFARRRARAVETRPTDRAVLNCGPARSGCPPTRRSGWPPVVLTTPVRVEFTESFRFLRSRSQGRHRRRRACGVAAR